MLICASSCVALLPKRKELLLDSDGRLPASEVVLFTLYTSDKYYMIKFVTEFGMASANRGQNQMAGNTALSNLARYLKIWNNILRSRCSFF